MRRYQSTVCVLGAGAVGLASALKLAGHGVDCLVLDRGEPGMGATLHSAGVVHSGARYAVTDPALAALCAREGTKLTALAPFARVARKRAYYVALTEEEEAYGEELVRACKSLGISITRVARRLALKSEPALSRSTRMAFAVPDAVTDPYLLVEAYREALASQGVPLLARTDLRSLAFEEGHWVLELRLEKGGLGAWIKTRMLLVAAGAWTPKVLEQCGIRLRVGYVNGSMFVFDGPAVSRIVARCAVPLAIDSVVPCYEHALVGSTWREQANPDPSPATDKDARDAREIARMLLGKPPGRLLRSYSAVRLVFQGESHATRWNRIGRRAFCVCDHGAQHGVKNLISAAGGKLTLHCCIAETATLMLLKKLGKKPNESALFRALRAPHSWPSHHLGGRRASLHYSRRSGNLRG